MAKDMSGKKQLLVSIKAEGKLLKKRLDSFLKSLVDNDVYDIKKNKDLSGLTSIELAQMMKFASDCAEGKLSDVISTYAGLDETKKSALPDRINELMTDIEENDKEDGTKDEEVPAEEEASPDAKEAAPAPEAKEEEAPAADEELPPLPEIPEVEAPTKEEAKPVEESKEKEEKEDKKEKVLKEYRNDVYDLPSISTVAIKKSMVTTSDVVKALEDEYDATVVDIGEWDIVKEFSGTKVVKAIDIQWEGQDDYDLDESYMMESDDPTMKVDIDHTGEKDLAALRYGISIRPHGKSHAIATGKKSALQKYLVSHYENKMEAMELHPDVFDMDESYMTEVAPPGKKMERMVRHIKRSARAGGASDEEAKRIAYATAWKRHNEGGDSSYMTEGVYSYANEYLNILKGR